MKERLIELGIDADDAIRRFNGKFELFIKSLKKFVKDISTNGVTSLNEIKTMDTEDFRKYIHGLKGVTANLSMITANTKLIEIEQSIKDGNPDYEKYGTFIPMFLETARLTLSAIESYETPAKALEAGSENECSELLTQLKQYLIKGMARECEAITTKLRTKSWDFYDTAQITEICNAVDAYDYTKALEQIESS